MRVYRIGSAILLLICSCLCFAHPPGLSSVDVLLGPQGLDAKVTFAINDIEAIIPMDSDFDAEVTPTEQEAAKPAIAGFVSNQLLLTADGVALAAAAPGNVSFDDQNNARIDLHFAATPAKTLTLQANYLGKFAAGHKQYVALKNAAQELGQTMLTQQAHTADFDLTTSAAESASKTGFMAFLELGIEHIVTGYDHLLFLFCLLVVTRNFWPAAKIITCFTIAHSITLGLAGANLVDIPGSIIEPFIAATIIYVGLENLLRKGEPKGRALLTFVFGLVHGFGFAGVLRELDITSGESGILLPLFSFNLGVEVGQLSIAALVLPLLWWLHKKPAIDKWLMPVGSSLACLAGAYWLVERTLL